MSEAMEQAKRFFALPEEKKMEVFTGLVPNEYVGFHPMECYNRNGWKHQGTYISMIDVNMRLIWVKI